MFEEFKPRVSKVQLAGQIQPRELLCLTPNSAAGSRVDQHKVQRARPAPCAEIRRPTTCSAPCTTSLGSKPHMASSQLVQNMYHMTHVMLLPPQPFWGRRCLRHRSWTGWRGCCVHGIGHGSGSSVGQIQPSLPGGEGKGAVRRPSAYLFWAV